MKLIGQIIGILILAYLIWYFFFKPKNTVAALKVDAQGNCPVGYINFPGGECIANPFKNINNVTCTQGQIFFNGSCTSLSNLIGNNTSTNTTTPTIDANGVDTTTGVCTDMPGAKVMIKPKFGGNPQYKIAEFYRMDCKYYKVTLLQNGSVFGGPAVITKADYDNLV